MKGKIIAALAVFPVAATMFAGVAHASPSEPECVFDGWCAPGNSDGAAPGYYDENGKRCPDPARPCVLDSINR